MAAEVLAAIVALFALGSFRYRLDKNALTYGAGLVTLATFMGIWVLPTANSLDVIKAVRAVIPEIQRQLPELRIKPPSTGPSTPPAAQVIELIPSARPRSSRPARPSSSAPGATSR